ncbi:FAD-dependent pyridine nucleotide-disulphide oxidoreductase [Syntrophomonas zehnderi OL-4]|uniref:FAD-dependent pyridine nucleotide-disulphide oxidoreductase n=1 Tax=Syntrophomonas zehnderi OL-4 TaxID=690567 RepID=A0A0E4C8D1_9FIRM|nr:NAD(P)/FAD-dependent oxidoreductase [Syntrophomonas zehnderi]CFX42568.1 FAD-dependent pyridine nucleotide-disulphide oxidoreductase [Syntrophomonas zehnderi OL-4]
MKKNKQVIVVGGGAAGMIAAISARRQGADVTILEKNPRIGKKILATGNGRCNFTNINADAGYYHGNNPKFTYSALSQFTADDTILFFEKLGIAHKVEEFGKVFPMSDQASSILDVFLYELNELGVNIVCDAQVKDIRKNDKFSVALVGGKIYKGDRVIITTGGKAMPASGSDGSGYDLAARLGHTIVDIFPALVQLKLESPFLKRLDGVKFVGTAEIIHNNKSVAKDRGDILFTDYGISGPPILQISRKAGELLKAGQEPFLKITIMDTMSKDELRKLLKKRWQISSSKPLDFSLVGFINKRLIPVVLMEAGISDVGRPVANLSAKEQERIIDLLIDWRFRIRGTKSWPSAQVTAGGVDTREINQDTMESKLVKGLFFAGEIIDIDGQCGGFNLQWAWSSGYIAGQCAAL